MRPSKQGRGVGVLTICLILMACGSRPEEAETVRPSLRDARHAHEVEQISVPVAANLDTAVVVPAGDLWPEMTVDTIMTETPDSITTATSTILEAEPQKVTRRVPATPAKSAIKDTVAQNISKQTPCSNPAPSFHPQRRPATRPEAQDLSRWMWQKAVCFRQIGLLDSCINYINNGIGIYENASLFTLRAAVEFEKMRFSAAKTAAEISISRYDHWDRSDRKRAFEYRMAALRGLLAAHPSSITKHELEKAEHEYQALFGDN